MDFGNGSCLGRRERREKISGSAGEKGLSGAGRTGDEDVMMSGDSDGEGAFGDGLSADMV